MIKRHPESIALNHSQSTRDGSANIVAGASYSLFERRKVSNCLKTQSIARARRSQRYGKNCGNEFSAGRLSSMRNVQEQGAAQFTKGLMEFPIVVANGQFRIQP